MLHGYSRKHGHSHIPAQIYLPAIVRIADVNRWKGLPSNSRSTLRNHVSCCLRSLFVGLFVAGTSSNHVLPVRCRQLELGTWVAGVCVRDRNSSANVLLKHCYRIAKPLRIYRIRTCYNFASRVDRKTN